MGSGGILREGARRTDSQTQRPCYEGGFGEPQDGVSIYHRNAGMFGPSGPSPSLRWCLPSAWKGVEDTEFDEGKPDAFYEPIGRLRAQGSGP